MLAGRLINLSANARRMAVHHKKLRARSHGIPKQKSSYFKRVSARKQSRVAFRVESLTTGALVQRGHS